MKQPVQGDGRNKLGRTLIASIKRIIQHQVQQVSKQPKPKKKELKNQKVVI